MSRPTQVHAARGDHRREHRHRGRGLPGRRRRRHIVLAVPKVTLAAPGFEDGNGGGDLDIASAIDIQGRGATVDAAGVDRVMQVLPTGAPPSATSPSPGGRRAAPTPARRRRPSATAPGTTAGTRRPAADGERRLPHPRRCHGHRKRDGARNASAFRRGHAVERVRRLRHRRRGRRRRGGGGIYSTGVLTLERSTVSANTTGRGGFGARGAGADAGASGVGGDGTGGDGGAGGRGAGIASTGLTTIEDSTIARNTTGVGGGGAPARRGSGSDGNQGLSGGSARGGDGGRAGDGAGLAVLQQRHHPVPQPRARQPHGLGRRVRAGDRGRRRPGERCDERRLRRAGRGRPGGPRAERGAACSRSPPAPWP